jgi:hypothetical protein
MRQIGASCLDSGLLPTHVVLSLVIQVTQVEFPVSLDPEASGRLEGRGKGEEDLPLVWLENATNVPVYYGQVGTFHSPPLPAQSQAGELQSQSGRVDASR